VGYEGEPCCSSWQSEFTGSLGRFVIVEKRGLRAGLSINQPNQPNQPNQLTKTIILQPKNEILIFFIDKFVIG